MGGWVGELTSRRSSPHKTATLVVPSPTSSSWVLAMSTRTLAAGLSICTAFRIVAPSLVTVTALFVFREVGGWVGG